MFGAKLINGIHLPFDEPSFWNDYDTYLMSYQPYDHARDEELLNGIEANPPPRELVELDTAIEPMVA